MDQAAAEDLLAQVRARTKVETAFLSAFSPVMVAHTGPGLVGLAWWLEVGRRGL
jgi:fatty acid-binding protein DegV